MSSYLDDIGRLPNIPPSTPETIANGSFEEGAGSIPDAWYLSSGQLGDSTTWELAGGINGGCCLRISPKGGGASWHAAPVPVSGGVSYLFRCAIKREGRRHWAHACDINWVSLGFFTESGDLCQGTTESPLIPVRSRQTAGWVSCWRYLTAPNDAKFLHVGFRIVRGLPDLNDDYGFRRFWHSELDTGNWWIDDVRLERMPLDVFSPNTRLVLEVPSGAARLRVTDSTGKPTVPEGVYTYQHGGGCFHAVRDEATMLLPPGIYTVEAMRGFQRKPFRRELTLAESAESRVSIELPRVADLPAQQWYEGDHHNHLSFHGESRHPLMKIDDMYAVARGEGLDYVSFCGEILDQDAYAEWRDAGCPSDRRPDGARSYKDLVTCVSHEVTQDLLGHLCLVNVPGHIAPGHPWWIAPTNAEIFEWVRRKTASGVTGAVVMAHPYDSLTTGRLLSVLADPKRTGMNRELPVDVALGLADTMDFLAMEAPADLELRFRDYFRLLNLGLRIGVSASSDVYNDQGTEMIGSLRTVVQADTFDMNAIAQGYRHQRTIATNGPVLQFRVNDVGIGGRTAGPHAVIEAKAFSIWGLTRLEIIAGGQVIADATPEPDGWASVMSEIVFDRSQWLIARAYGPANPILNCDFVEENDWPHRGQWAVTSPIYVDVPGRPIIPIRADAEYFIRWIDACSEAIQGRQAAIAQDGPNGPDMREEHVTAALDLFRRGREVYKHLARLGAE